jgi:hypothetical protein
MKIGQRQQQLSPAVVASTNLRAKSFTSTPTSAGPQLRNQGFSMKQPEPGAHGFGLPAMCERANRLGGRMDINSGQGSGTEIRMSVPLPGKTSKERKDQ